MSGLIGFLLIIMGFGVLEYRVWLSKEAGDEGLPTYLVVVLNILIYFLLVIAHEAIAGRIG